MKKSRLNPGPHICPPISIPVPDTPGGAFKSPFMKVPAHLQGYVLEYMKLDDKDHWKRSDLLQEIFWATMKALPEWLEKAPKDALCYELRADWNVVAMIDDGNQD